MKYEHLKKQSTFSSFFMDSIHQKNSSPVSLARDYGEVSWHSVWWTSCQSFKVGGPAAWGVCRGVCRPTIWVGGNCWDPYTHWFSHLATPRNVAMLLPSVFWVRYDRNRFLKVWGSQMLISFCLSPTGLCCAGLGEEFNNSIYLTLFNASFIISVLLQNVVTTPGFWSLHRHFYLWVVIKSVFLWETGLGTSCSTTLLISLSLVNLIYVNQR